MTQKGLMTSRNLTLMGETKQEELEHREETFRAIQGSLLPRTSESKGQGNRPRSGLMGIPEDGRGHGLRSAGGRTGWAGGLPDRTREGKGDLIRPGRGRAVPEGLTRHGGGCSGSGFRFGSALFRVRRRCPRPSLLHRTVPERHVSDCPAMSGSAQRGAGPGSGLGSLPLPATRACGPPGLAATTSPGMHRSSWGLSGRSLARGARRGLGNVRLRRLDEISSVAQV
ncbi:uncharacterized protein LOC144579590 isoform X2 [Callithrix jacchus]